MNLNSHIIIIAEDEILIRMMAADALTSAGFTVIDVEHAAAALTILQVRATEICALFTDINMPGAMDGLELAHHTFSHWPWIGLLIASGNAQPADNDLPTGCRFLPKPYDPNHLVGHMKALATAG